MQENRTCLHGGGTVEPLLTFNWHQGGVSSLFLISSQFWSSSQLELQLSRWDLYNLHNYNLCKIGKQNPKFRLMSPQGQCACFMTKRSLCYQSWSESLLLLTCTLSSAQQAPAGPAVQSGATEKERRQPQCSTPRGQQSTLSFINLHTSSQKELSDSSEILSWLAAKWLKSCVLFLKIYISIIHLDLQISP